MSMRRSLSLSSTSGASITGHTCDGGEARLAAAVVVERADAHQAVGAPLALHQPVGVAPGDGELGRQDAGLGALGDVVDLDVEAAALGPAAVHAQQHLGPVLGVDPAVLGVDLQMASASSCSPVNRLRSSSWSRRLGERLTAASSSGSWVSSSSSRASSWSTSASSSSRASCRTCRCRSDGRTRRSPAWPGPGRPTGRGVHLGLELGQPGPVVVDLQVGVGLVEAAAPIVENHAEVVGEIRCAWQVVEHCQASREAQSASGDFPPRGTS